ncbi:quinate 5-dehydrogenase [bacterium]|nr:quinate 5-dehydrogenase [bacterium]
MLKIVSVSLGSSSRDSTKRAVFLDEDVELSRIGTDGDMNAAVQIIRDLDGQVDAIGLGGIDLYLCAGKRKYAIRDAKRLARAAKTTPIVDGSGLKLTLEPRQVHQLAESFEGPPLRGAKILLVSGVDRWGMAESLAQYAHEIIFGDLIFGLGIPMPLRSLPALLRVAAIMLPILTILPFKLLYPTGSKQKEHRPRHGEYLIWADWICGDFHYINRNLPPRLDGKVILTNTTTAEDQDRLRAAGLSYLITTTPVIEGRSFGMNVMEACLVALMRKRGDMPTPENYEVYLNKLNLKPNIMRLNQ